MVINISYYIFHKNNIKHNQLLLEKNLLSQQNDLLTHYYKTLDDIFEGLKNIRIEVNNHLQIMWILSKNPKVKDFEKYSIQIHGINSQLSRMYVTGSNIIDAVLWNKSLLGERKNIVLETDVELPTVNCMSLPDLGSILDFLLDAFLNNRSFDRVESKLFVIGKEHLEHYEIIVNDDPGELSIDDLQCMNDLPSKEVSQEIKIILSIVKKNNGAMYYKPDHAAIIRIPIFKQAQEMSG